MSDALVHLEAARQAALLAGKMLRERIGRSGEVRAKDDLELVTECDRQSQDLICGFLDDRFPDYDVLAEEGLTRGKGSPFRWVIDPLDGTTNFAHGFPIFGVAIALEVDGRTETGVVYDPVREEMYWAVLGGGAFLNGNRIRVSSVSDLGGSLLATGFPYDIRRSRANIGNFERFLLRAQAIRRCGAAALDLCYVASGRFDGFWELKLKPWDVSAAALIVREAGGRTTDFAGSEFSSSSPQVLASNGRLHPAMLEVLAHDGGERGLA